MFQLIVESCLLTLGGLFILSIILNVEIKYGCGACSDSSGEVLRYNDFKIESRF